MANPFFNRFGNNQAPNSGPFGNVTNLMSRFNEFKASFQGNPQEQVQQLLNSGKMSQEQFNQLSNLAKQFQSMMK